MGVSGHEHVLVVLALLLQFAEQDHHIVHHCLQLAACEKAQVNEYLVVSASSGMNFLAHVAQSAGKHKLNLGMYVFNAVLDAEMAFLYVGIDAAKFCKKLFQLVGFKKPDAFQHGDVGHGTQDIILCQIKVHFAVASYGEAFYFTVCVEILLPEFHCECVLYI